MPFFLPLTLSDVVGFVGFVEASGVSPMLSLIMCLAFGMFPGWLWVLVPSGGLPLAAGAPDQTFQGLGPFLRSLENHFDHLFL